MKASSAGAVAARPRRPVRAGLLLLAVPNLAIGAWALLRPHSFYADFPGVGRHWVAALGPYNEHLVTDFGGLSLGLSVLVGLAAVVLERTVVLVALAAWLTAAVPHLAYHVTTVDAFSTGDDVAQLAGLTLYVVVPLALLALVRRSAQQGASPTAARPGARR